MYFLRVFVQIFIFFINLLDQEMRTLEVRDSPCDIKKSYLVTITRFY